MLVCGRLGVGFGVLLCLVSIPHGMALGWVEFCRVFQVGSQPNLIGWTGRFWSLGSPVAASPPGNSPSKLAGMMLVKICQVYNISIGGCFKYFFLMFTPTYLGKWSNLKPPTLDMVQTTNKFVGVWKWHLNNLGVADPNTRPRWVPVFTWGPLLPCICASHQSTMYHRMIFLMILRSVCVFPPFLYFIA